MSESSSQNQTQVSITAKFSFPEGDTDTDTSTSNQEPTTVTVVDVDHTFDSSNCQPAILGLPPGVDPVKVSLSALSLLDVACEWIHSFCGSMDRSISSILWISNWKRSFASFFHIIVSSTSIHPFIHPCIHVSIHASIRLAHIQYNVWHIQNKSSTPLQSYNPINHPQPKGGDYSYSGMHDHGPLPAPKEGGDFALLIHMVQQAKKKSDELLTNVIEKEKNSAKMKRLEKQGQGQGQGSKKQKVERWQRKWLVVDVDASSASLIWDEFSIRLACRINPMNYSATHFSLHVPTNFIPTVPYFSTVFQ